MSSNKKFIIDTNQAPRAFGAYSQAIGFAGLVFISGQIAVDPKTGRPSEAGIEDQTRRVMDNLQAILLAAGLDFSHVVKTTVYMRSLNDLDAFNDVYSLYFDHGAPARSIAEVSRLPKDALVQVELIAAAPVEYDQIGASELQQEEE